METNTKQKYYRRWQKGSLLLGLLVLVATMVMGLHQQTAKAAVPYYINFQGKITKNSDGTNVADGNYAIQFKIYDAASSGNLLWTETWDATTTQVNITNGVFNVKLGTYTSLATVDFTGGSLYLTVNFNPGAGYDGEMLPRKQLVTSAFAFNASNVVGNGRIAITTTSTTQSALQVTYNPDASTSTPAAVITASSNETGPALKVVQNGTGYAGIFTGGNVGIGTVTPATTLYVQGSGSTNPFQVSSSTGSGLMVVTSQGNVGIGTTGALVNALEVDANSGNSGQPVINGYNSYSDAIAKLGTGHNGSGAFFQLSPKDGSGNLRTWSVGSNVTLASNYFEIRDNTAAGSPDRLVIDTSGNVGIGTSAPATTLSIQGSGSTDLLNIASSSGTSVMYISKQGNVGIGLTSPNYKLEVAGTASATALNIVGNINNATLTASSLVMSDAAKNLRSVQLGSGLTITGNTLNTTQAGGVWTVGNGLIYNATSTDLVGIGTITPTTTLFVQGKAGTNPFAIASSTGTQLLTVTQAGWVGIGSSTPSAPFIEQTNGSSAAVANWFSGNTQVMSLNWNGNLYVNGLASLGGGSSSAFAQMTANGTVITRNIADANTALTVQQVNNGSTGDILDLKNATSTVAVVTSAGNVGIGTTTPGQALTVSGNISNLLDSNNLPVLVSSTTLTNYSDFYIKDKYLYGVDFSASGKLYIVDVSNPNLPVLKSSLAIGDHPRHIRVLGRYAYIAVNFENSLAIVDISNPTKPVLMSKTVIPDGNQVRNLDVQGKYAYLSGYNSTKVTVMDISNPSAPAQVGDVTIGGQPTSVLASGRYVYSAGDGDGIFAVLDIANPASPVLVATTTISCCTNGMASFSHYIYTTNFGSGNVNVVDVASSTAPTVVTSFTASGMTFNSMIAVAGRYLYVAGDKLDVYDISSSTSPTLLTSIPNVIGYDGLFVSDRYVYFGDGNNDLVIYDLRGTETNALVAGSADLGQLDVRGNILTAGSIQSSGLNIGSGGIYSAGGLGVLGTSSFMSYVGIGTTTPSAPLQLAANSASVGSRSYSLLIRPENAGSAARFAFQSSGSANGSLMGESFNGAGDFAVYTAPDANFSAGTATWTNRMIVTNAGAAGFGSSTPGGIFDVQAAADSVQAMEFASNNGTVILNIDSTNKKVGIGTTTPGNALTVIGSISSSALTNGNCVQAGPGGVLQSASGACGSGTGSSAFTIGSGLIYNSTSTDLVGIGTITPTTTLFVQGKGGTNPFAIASSTGTQLLTLTQAGNLGIGIANPSSPLTIADNVTNATVAYLGGQNSWSPGNEVRLDMGQSNGIALSRIANYYSGNGSDWGLKFYSYTGGNINSTPNMTLAGNNNTGVGTTTPSARLSVTGTSAVDPFDISSTSGVSLMHVTQAGYVGIGTTTPGNALTVIGSISSSNLTSGNCVQAGAGGVLQSASGACGSGGGNSSFTVGSGKIYNATSTDLVGIGTITPLTTLFVQGKGGTNPFAIASSTGTQMLTLNQNGYLGLGTSTPGGLLTLQGTGSTAINLLNIASTTGASMLSTSWYGGLTQNISSTTAVNIQDGSSNSVFAIDTTQSSSNAGMDITAGGSQTGNLLNVYSSGSTLLSGISAYGGWFENISSTSAMSIQNGSGIKIFAVDTLNGVINMATTSSTTINSILTSDGNLTIGDDGLTGTTDGRLWLRSRGTIFRFNSTGNTADYSEYFYQLATTTQDVGTVMTVDNSTTTPIANAGLARVASSSYDSNTLGVVTNTGTNYNNPDDNRQFDPHFVDVGMLGHIKVKVTDENGPINPGDYLTSSAKFPGYAMKATRSGRVIGISIMDWESCTGILDGKSGV